MKKNLCVCIWMMFMRKSNWKTLMIKYRTTSGNQQRQWDATRLNAGKPFGQLQKTSNFHTSHQIVTLPIFFPSVVCILNPCGLVLFCALCHTFSYIGRNIILADYGGIYDYFSHARHITLYFVHSVCMRVSVVRHCLNYT